MIGAMIVTNTPGVESLKDVKYVMILTDDSLQDDHAVVAAKAIIYTSCLPDNVKFVKFSSDGAGNYKSKLH